jgi:hypothetical protein
MDFDHDQLVRALTIYNGDDPDDYDGDDPDDYDGDPLYDVVKVTNRKSVEMSIPDSDLIVEFEMVFQVVKNPGTYWMVVGHRMNDYYMSQVGDDCEPFGVYGQREIPCVQVYPHSATTTTYKTTPPA